MLGKTRQQTVEDREQRNMILGTKQLLIKILRTESLPSHPKQEKGKESGHFPSPFLPYLYAHGRNNEM